MLTALGAYKVAAIGSAAAVTLAAGGLALSDLASIMASFAGVLVSVVTLGLMARKALKSRRPLPPPPVAPIPPPGLPLGRVTRDEYAHALEAQKQFTQQVLDYADALERYYQQHGDAL